MRIRGTLLRMLVSLQVCGLLAACHRQPQEVILQREWVANAEFAGDVWAQALSHGGSYPITVREGSELTDPIRAVRSGAAQFGVASADRVLRENERGGDLVILAAATYKSPVVFLSHPADRIASPADFAGHKVGIQSGTNTELVYRILAAKIAAKNVKVVESGWGTSNFETHTIDVLGAFIYDEPIQLKLKSVPFRVLQPEDYGISFVGTVYFAKRTLLEKQRPLVQSFIDNLVHGWRLSIGDPAKAVAQIHSVFPNISEKKEKLSLIAGLPLFSGDGGRLLYSSPARFSATAGNLVSLGLLKSPEIRREIDYTFLNAALNKAEPR